MRASRCIPPWTASPAWQRLGAHQPHIVRLDIAIHPYPQEATMRVPKLDVFASPDIYLQVLDQRGRVLASSGNLGNRTLPLMRDAIAAEQVRALIGYDTS